MSPSPPSPSHTPLFSFPSPGLHLLSLRAASSFFYVFFKSSFTIIDEGTWSYFNCLLEHAKTGCVFIWPWSHLGKGWISRLLDSYNAVHSQRATISPQVNYTLQIPLLGDHENLWAWGNLQQVWKFRQLEVIANLGTKHSRISEEFFSACHKNLACNSVL